MSGNIYRLIVSLFAYMVLSCYTNVIVQIDNGNVIQCRHNSNEF